MRWTRSRPTPTPLGLGRFHDGGRAKGFLDRYVTDDGRVQRIDQGGDTVGEGQAYGMLIAAAVGDEERFDAIWDWTKSNIRARTG